MADTDVGWAHAQALAGMLAGLPYPLYVGEVSDEDDTLTYPHLILWPPPATRPTVTLNGYAGEVTTVTQITAVGTTPREAITALDRVSALLHRRRPSIAGRRCSLVTATEGAAGSPQPQPDDQARTADGRRVFFTFGLFSLYSSPETANG